MRENCELVQRGFRILLESLSGFIGREMRKAYKNDWWKEVLRVLYDQQRDLPVDGDYGDLIDSLDIANCFRLLDREWGDVFRLSLSPSCRAWARELMGVRNTVSHLGQKDLEQREAERALDTMRRLCEAFDKDSAEEIEEVYQIARSRSEDGVVVEYTGLAQPESDSNRGALREGSLLLVDDPARIEKTTITRKVTYGGKTTVYPVYRVRLDQLFYNDQNDRIATWMSRYEAEHGSEALQAMDREQFNDVIEEFIYQSNPAAISKTQTNIGMVGQREPGVTLADGRVVDGNRRFTCLRRLQRATSEPLYFETVIMDMDIREDKKQIKLLELAIQHGEEKKVDYDLLDFAVGTYRDIVQTGLLTVEEYAASTNETQADVKKRIEIAGLINEFLQYIRLPEQYHEAREYQVYELFNEMRSALRRLQSDEQKTLKAIVFNNAVIKAVPDQRRFIRDVHTLIKNEAHAAYFAEQVQLGQEFAERLAADPVQNKADVDSIAAADPQLAGKMRESLERAQLRMRAQVLKQKPAESVAKCVALLMDVDPRLFGKMEPEDLQQLKAELEDLDRIVQKFRSALEG